MLSLVGAQVDRRLPPAGGIGSVLLVSLHRATGLLTRVVIHLRELSG